MGRKTIVIVTDDLTGEEVPEAEAEDVMLKFGYDEWTLVLTPASRAKVLESLSPTVQNAAYKDARPKWMVAKEAAAQGDAAEPGTSQPKPTVTIVPPDNTTVRRWWGDLTPADLRRLDLKPPASGRGKIPEAVMSAFVTAHAAPTPAFSG